MEVLLEKKEKELYRYQREVFEMKELVKESQDIVDQISSTMVQN